MFGSENTKQKTLLLLPAEAPTGLEASVAQHSPAEKHHGMIRSRHLDVKI